MRCAALMEQFPALHVRAHSADGSLAEWVNWCIFINFYNVFETLKVSSPFGQVFFSSPFGQHSSPFGRSCEPIRPISPSPFGRCCEPIRPALHSVMKPTSNLPQQWHFCIIHVQHLFTLLTFTGSTPMVNLNRSAASSLGS